MAASEPHHVERLQADDAPSGLALSAAAGWNQTLADWRLFIARGSAFGVRDEERRLIATAAALSYEGGTGWISMVLVDAAHRHRGLATALMDHAVQALRSAQVAVLLDATPAGAEVYRRIGFVAGFALDRWEGEATGAGTASAPAPADTQIVMRLDREATGLGRVDVLQNFLARPDTRCWLAPEHDAFVLARRGHRAWQIGPLMAPDEHSAVGLVQRALAGLVGRVYLDVPRSRTLFTTLLGVRGFVPQRSFVRMALDAGSPSLPERVHVLAGPEYG